jgi:hypothetical protein
MSERGGREGLHYLKVMHEATGSGDDDVRVGGELIELRLQRVTTHHYRHAQREVFVDLLPTVPCRLSTTKTQTRQLTIRMLLYDLPNHLCIPTLSALSPA